MISRRIHTKPENDDYGRLARYCADTRNNGEKVLESWHRGSDADDYHLAIREVEAVQALNTRSRKEKTYHLIVSFRPEDEPLLTPEVFREIEEEFARALGFNEHQRHCGVHKNTNNIHMHVAYNMIHPVKLTRHEPYRDYRKRDEAARKLEKRFGLVIDKGRQPEESPKRSNDKAAQYEAHTGRQSFAGYVMEHKEALAKILECSDWPEFHAGLARFGLGLKLRGSGCVIHDLHSPHTVKASSLGRDFAKKALEQKLGPFQKCSELFPDSAIRYEGKPLQPHQAALDLFKEFHQAMNAPRRPDVSRATRSWNTYLKRRAVDGDNLALDVLRSLPSVGATPPEAVPNAQGPEKPTVDESHELERLLFTAFREITERRGIFRIPELHAEMQEYCSLREKKLNTSTLKDFLSRPDMASRFVAMPGKSPRDPRFTTRELLQAEADNRAYLIQGKERFPLHCSPEDLARDLDRNATKLFDFSFAGEQRDAALGILTSEDFITCVQGDPGTGKTTMLQAVVATHGKNQTIGLSKAGLAAKKLGDETEVWSMTIDRFCIDYERRQLALASDRSPKVLEDTAYIEKTFSQGQGLLIVDEASMMGSMDASRLCAIAAREKARLVLVGDTKQLPGVGAGKPFELWQEQGAPTFRLQEIRRQKSTQERAAVEAVTRHDDVAAALEYLENAENSSVRVVADDKERMASVVEEYFNHVDQTRKPPLLITSLNKDRLVFNEQIREGLKARGQIFQETERLQDVELPTGEIQPRKMAVGDEIIFTRRPSEQDVQVAGDQVILNGTRARISAIKNGNYTVQFPGGAVGTFGGKTFRHFDHAYSLSTYKAQGQSEDAHVIYHAPVYSPLLTRNEFLVGISRNKHHVSIYTDSQEKLLEKARKLAIKKTALETFERGVLRSEGTSYLKALSSVVAQRMVDDARAREERKTAVRDAGDWSKVPYDERKRINALYQKARDDFSQALHQAEKFVAQPNALEMEALHAQKEFLKKMEALETVQGSQRRWAMAERRRIEAAFIKTVTRQYAPQGSRARWHPTARDVFSHDTVISPEKQRLLKEYRTAHEKRRAAWKMLRQERERRYKALRSKWQTQRRQWKRDSSLLGRDTMRLINLSKAQQLAEEEKLRAEFVKRRNQLREEMPFLGWAGFVQHKAREGSKAALEIWSTMGETPSLVMDQKKHPDQLLDSLQRRVDNRGNVLYTLANGGMVKDNGRRIHFSRDEQSRKVALALARRKYGPHFIRENNTLCAGKRQENGYEYTLANGIVIRETENAVSCSKEDPGAKRIAEELAGRKLGKDRGKILDSGLIVESQRLEHGRVQ